MLEDSLLYTFVYGSCVYWSCFLLCELTFTKALAKAGLYAIVMAFYAGITALYFMTPFASLSFIEYIIPFLLFIIMPLLYKDSISKIIFTYFSNLLFCLILHITSNIITNHTFNDISNRNLVENLTPEILFRAITLILMVIFTILLVTAIKRVFHQMLADTSNSILAAACIFPILSFIILLVNYLNLAVDLNEWNANVIVLITLILLILSIYVVLYVSFCTSNTVRTEPKPKPIASLPAKSNKAVSIVQKEVISDPQDLLTGGRGYYEMLLNHYMDMNNRTQLLDNQMQTMNSLLLNDNVAGATVFVDRISKTFHDHDIMNICSNQTINLLLSYNHYVCKQEQIYLDTQVNLPGQLPIPDLELCVLFGNCMNNAIEACGYLKDRNSRFIHVESKIQNGILFIVIDNSFDGFINKVNNQLKSRKKFGGVGLKTVQAVVGKYKGSIDMEYPQNVFSISLKLPLNPKSVIREAGSDQTRKSTKQHTTGKTNKSKKKK